MCGATGWVWLPSSGASCFGAWSGAPSPPSPPVCVRTRWRSGSGTSSEPCLAGTSAPTFAFGSRWLSCMPRCATCDMRHATCGGTPRCTRARPMNLPSSTASILLLIHFLHLHIPSFHQCPRFFNLQLYCLPSPSCVACPADLNSLLLGWLSHFPALCSVSRLAFPWLMFSPAAQYGFWAGLSGRGGLEAV